MIEFSCFTRWSGTWYELTEDGFHPREDDFERLNFKIDGVKYTKWNKEFEQAWLMHELKKDYTTG